MAWAVFAVLSILCVGAVLAMILSRNQAHNALFLVLAFASLGGLFGLLDAPFAAVVQVLVYAGAIMVLFLFAVMMFNLRAPSPSEKKSSRLILAGGLGLVLLVELLIAVRGVVRIGPSGSPPLVKDPLRLGQLLFSDYLYAFELTSLLIVAALVGALALTSRERES